MMDNSRVFKAASDAPLSETFRILFVMMFVTVYYLL
jgi:hypothetical protein